VKNRCATEGLRYAGDYFSAELFGRVFWRYGNSAARHPFFLAFFSSWPPTDDCLFLSGQEHGRWATSHVPDMVLPLMTCCLIRTYFSSSSFMTLKDRWVILRYNTGRCAPEIDIFEAERDKVNPTGQVASQSAPFTQDYVYPNARAIYNTNMTVPNSYHGSAAPPESMAFSSSYRDSQRDASYIPPTKHFHYSILLYSQLMGHW
jgi:Beta-glucan synthesis-associated protein SKN1/KRE6/Sbg1